MKLEGREETTKSKQWVAAALVLSLLMLMPGLQRAENVSETMTEEKYIALTFDDGPSPETTPVLLDGLKARGVHVSFFVLGAEAEKEPELLRRMQAEGHQIAQHTYSHVRLNTLNDAALTEELQKTNALLQDILGEGDYWIRPPYGLIRQRQYALAPAPLITWSVDPEDWKLREEKAVSRAVVEQVRSGDIVLLHDIYPSSVSAALNIVDELQKQGYTFLTVQELMQVYGVDAKAGELYRSPLLPGPW